MLKQTFVLKFKGPQGPNVKAKPYLPNLDVWIFYVTVDENDIYVKFEEGDYWKMKDFIKECDQIQLITEYMGFEDFAQDGRFELKKEFIDPTELRIIAEECSQDKAQ